VWLCIRLQSYVNVLAENVSYFQILLSLFSSFLQHFHPRIVVTFLSVHSRAVRRIPVALLAAAASTSSSEAETAAAAVTALTQPLTDYMCKALHDGVPALTADLTGLFTERLPTLEATGEVAHGMAALSLADTVDVLFVCEREREESVLLCFCPWYLLCIPWLGVHNVLERINRFCLTSSLFHSLIHTHTQYL